MEVTMLIENKGIFYAPLVEDGITWSTDRKGAPGQINFSVVMDDTINFTEGNSVTVHLDGKGFFSGFVFDKKHSKDKVISVTAYDQLRYLKNKDTYVYENKTASEIVKMLAADFNLQIGEIEDTGYKIPSRVEDNKSLFDIIQTALDLTLQNRKEMFVLFDSCGKLTLKSISSMKVMLLIDEETAENFNYSSSIDSQTYNQIKLIYDNEETGERDVFITKSGDNIMNWGVLQFFEKLQKGENGKAKAEALLSLYNSKTRTLSINNALGDIRVRAGCMIAVQLDLGDIKLKNMMLVEKCKHTFKQDEHLMDLTLRGGEFIA